MATRARPVESLTPADFLKHRVWEFVSNDEPDETYVNPVKRLPVSSLESRIIGVEVQLASGRVVWAFLGNVDAHDARRTHHFLTISVLAHDEWFHLTRYHDVNRDEHGPARLAGALGLRINEGSWACRQRRSSAAATHMDETRVADILGTRRTSRWSRQRRCGRARRGSARALDGSFISGVRWR